MSNKLSTAPLPKAGRWYVNDLGEDKARLVYQIGWSESGLVPMIIFRERIRATNNQGYVLTQQKVLVNQYKGWFKSYTIQPEGWEPSWLAGIKIGESCKP